MAPIRAMAVWSSIRPATSMAPQPTAAAQGTAATDLAAELFTN
jgi:hypothetical protein